MRIRNLMLLGLAGMLVLGAAGCSDDDDPAAPAATPAFALRIYQDTGIRKAPMASASFAMEIAGSLPTVTVGGETVAVFHTEGNIVYGGVAFPLTGAVAWSVSRGDRTVSGTIDLPTGPDAVTCNGTTIVPSASTNVAPAESYVFAWTGAAADHFVCRFTGRVDGDWTNWRTTVDVPTATFAVGSGVVPEEFSLEAVNGSALAPGATPNASGWAEGYVSAHLYGGWYGLDATRLGGLAPEPVPLHEQLARFLD